MPVVKLNAVLQARMIAMLWHGATTTEVVEETGLHRLTVNEYVQCLRKEEVCFIVRWTEDSLGRLSVAEHKLGAGVDAKRTPRPRKSRARSSYKRARDAQLLGLTT